MTIYKEVFIATTDTVVGLGAPVSEENFHAIYKLKKRDYSKPLIIMVASIEQARQFKEWNQESEKLAKTVWPGAVTLVISDKLAMRMPNSQGLLHLIDKIGPIYMTSANPSGGKTLSFEEAVKYFKQVKKHYNFGQGSGQPSTIIRVKDGKVLR